jgi:hypothetical protein
MRILPLNEYVQAIADVNGIAVASTGPRMYGQAWIVKMLHTSTNSTSESQLRVYRGVEVDSALVASSYSGNQDNAGGSTIEVPAQDKLIFVWSNASVDAICTCRIEGELHSARM